MRGNGEKSGEQAGERWEYFRHSDGDLYRAKPPGVAWQIDVWGTWEKMDLPLSNQDWDSFYRISEDEALKRVAADVESLEGQEPEEAEASQGRLFDPAGDAA